MNGDDHDIKERAIVQFVDVYEQEVSAEERNTDKPIQ